MLAGACSSLTLYCIAIFRPGGFFFHCLTRHVCFFYLALFLLASLLRNVFVANSICHGLLRIGNGNRDTVMCQVPRVHLQYVGQVLQP